MELERYAQAWRERFATEARERAQLESEAHERATACARMLAEGFGARRVWLVGSLTREGRFRERSDVDLVVEGLRGDLYWEALVEVCEAAGRQVDLIRSEDSPALATLARREGRLLYECDEVPAPQG